MVEMVDNMVKQMDNMVKQMDSMVVEKVDSMVVEKVNNMENFQATVDGLEQFLAGLEESLDHKEEHWNITEQGGAEARWGAS